MPRAVFLLPGVGAQGGQVEELADRRSRPARRAARCRASRGIVDAYARLGGDPVAAAAGEAARLRELTWETRARPLGGPEAACMIAPRWRVGVLSRFLAPVALAAVIAGAYIVVHAGLKSDQVATVTQPPLTVPTDHPHGALATAKFYVVHPSDTLTKISQAHGCVRRSARGAEPEGRSEQSCRPGQS